MLTSNSHSKTNLCVHLVWSPKYRKKILVGQFAWRVRDILREVATGYKIHIISGKVAPDYVHIIVSFQPNQTISKIVQYLKGASGHQIFREFPEVRKELWGGHFWQTGYFASTAHTVSDETIAKYIEEDDEKEAVEKTSANSDQEAQKIFKDQS